MLRGVISLSFFLFVHLIYAGQRESISLNSGWEFSKGEFLKDIKSWQKINLPHTWNTEDPFDEKKGYYRGAAWYRKHLEFSEAQLEKHHFIHFEAVNQKAEVYLNGHLLKTHIGGYTGFYVAIDSVLQSGQNVLLVKADNSHDKEIIPLKGDFNFYGGIYRDVRLISLNSIHFHPGEFGDYGVFVDFPYIEKESALINVRSNIFSVTSRNALLNFRLFNDKDSLILSHNEMLNLSDGINKIQSVLPIINHPERWSPNLPKLYSLQLSLLDPGHNGLQLDKLVIPIGFKTFRFDSEKGFFINDQSTKLLGANRHQDYAKKGNALTNSIHRQDMGILKEMGGNFYRTAHYPQDPAVLRACDSLGLLVSMEIPLDHDLTDSPRFNENCKKMLIEMIRQNYNHPSIIIWAYMNEMLLGRNYERDKGEIKKIYDLALQIEKIARSEDPGRYTMIPNHGDLDLYMNSGLTDIAMINAWNLYFGWYENELGAGKFLDEYHNKFPNKPVLVTEFGAGADPRIRSFEPIRFDFSQEWATRFHQENLKDFMERNYLAGAAVWNLADFGSENRNDAVPKINSKGLISFDRNPKDVFYFYKAALSKTPILEIGAKNWDQRFFFKKEQIIEVFYNGEEPKLQLNEKEISAFDTSDYLNRYIVNLNEGNNWLRSNMTFKGETVVDSFNCTFNLVDASFIYENRLRLNCGSNFFFIESINKQWIPDYDLGDFGNVLKGDVFFPRNRGIGSDRDILNTNLEPIYQTMRIDPVYQFDLDTGNYKLNFHFSNNLNEISKFRILINNEPVGEVLNFEEKDFFKAKIIELLVRLDQKGLEIKFINLEGKSFLNALEIEKI